MKDILNLISEISKGNPTINWSLLFIFCAAIILFWKSLEKLFPKAILYILKLIGKSRKERQDLTRQEIEIREYVKNSLRINWLAYVPAVSKYHADFPISDIYEPLQFNLFSEGRRVNFIKIERVLSESPSFAVVGGAGSGKSTLLNVLAIAYAEDDVEKLFGLKESRLPIFFNLKEFSEAKPLPVILTDALNSSGCSIKVDFIETQLKTGRCLILLDGLDETPEYLRKKEIIPWIQRMIAAYPQNRYIISSREAEWNERRVPGLPKITIRELSWSQIISIINKWESKLRPSNNHNNNNDSSNYPQCSLSQLLEEKDSSEVRELAKSPLLLTLMIILNENRISIPTRKHELYTIFIKVLLTEWEDSKNINLLQMEDSANEIEYRLRYFGELSLFLLENKYESIDLNISTIRNKCESLLIDINNQHRASLKIFLSNIYKRTGLITEVSDTKYSFVVRGFLEFLAAYAITNYNPNYPTLKYCNDESWFETISHISAMIHDPESFFNDLANISSSNKCRQLEVIAVGLLENRQVNRENYAKWLNSIEKEFEMLISNGIDCHRLARILYELSPKNAQKILSESLLSNNQQISKVSTACLLKANNQDFLNIISKEMENVSKKTLLFIAKELANNNLEQSVNLLWRIVESTAASQEAINSLVEKGDTIIQSCINVINNEYENETKLKAATKILCTLKEPSSLELLLNVRRRVSPHIAYYILENIKFGFFPERDIPIRVFEISTNMYITYIKRASDLIFSITFLIIFIPLLVVCALIIKIDSPGPIFFIQQRVGKGKKIFNIMKLRTMHQDLERSGPVWASDADPRVTKFGRFLRKTMLDELPLYFNVIKGDMSIVGPRPEIPLFFDKLSEILPFYDAKIIIKPGITGWAQVEYAYGASVENAREKLIYDLDYIFRCSFCLDLKIVFKAIYRTIIAGY